MKQDFEPVEADPSELNEEDLGVYSTEAVVTATDWTTETILSQIKRGSIDLSPHFQRREAWINDRKSAFIESLFIGLPVPQIVLAERRDKKGHYIVIDGKQRLLSMRRFGVEHPTEDFDALILTGLTKRRDLNGHTWTSLNDSPEYREQITAYQNQTIRTVVIRNWHDISFLYLVFLRLNSGGVPLSTQELRQALHPGSFTDYVQKYSADSDAIKRALKIDAPDFRMRDVEILVRFFAFADSLESYRGDLRAFLDGTTERLNKEWNSREIEINQLAGQCDLAINTTIQIFGEDAFRRWRKATEFERRFNRAVFDIMTYYFKDPEISRHALAQSDDVKAAFIALSKNDEQFTEALQTTTSSVEATFGRLSKWGHQLGQVLNVILEIPKTPRNRRRG